MCDDLPQSPPASSGSCSVQWLPRIWRLGVTIAWLKVAMNLTVRDQVPHLAVLYYAVPTIVLSLAAALLACFGSRLGRSRLAVWSLYGLAAMALIVWLRNDFRTGPGLHRSPVSVRAVFWNVGRGHFGEWDEISAEIRQFDADVVAIAEATSEDLQTIAYWRDRMPDYSALPLNDGIVLLIRGKAKLLERGSLSDRGNFRRLQISVRRTECEIIVADVVSDPWVSRQPALRKLWKVMQQQADRPTLVVGDFNTPPNSAYFDPWRATWKRAWDAAGVGYEPTWPQPLPVLALDHVWGNRWLRFLHCVGGWSSYSDHRPVLFEYELLRSTGS